MNALYQYLRNSQETSFQDYCPAGSPVLASFDVVVGHALYSTLSVAYAGSVAGAMVLCGESMFLRDFEGFQFENKLSDLVRFLLGMAFAFGCYGFCFGVISGCYGLYRSS